MLFKKKERGEGGPGNSIYNWGGGYRNRLPPKIQKSGGTSKKTTKCQERGKQEGRKSPRHVCRTTDKRKKGVNRERLPLMKSPGLASLRAILRSKNLAKGTGANCEEQAEKDPRRRNQGGGLRTEVESYFRQFTEGKNSNAKKKKQPGRINHGGKKRNAKVKKSQGKGGLGMGKIGKATLAGKEVTCSR